MDFKEKINSNPVFSLISKAAADTDVYVVGGYVRDLLLKKESKDIDIVCVGDGIELANRFARLLPGRPAVNVFKNFGTAQLRYNHMDIEFVGARKESYSPDSRNPDVVPGSLQDDQLRRDFTINAMAICLNSDRFGEFIDPFAGQADLKSKMIRTPANPEVTFSDDPLRMMRAFRFAAQLNFDIEPLTFEAIQRQKDRIAIVSPERITDELNKLILSPHPGYGFNLMFQAGILQVIFPEMVELQGVTMIDGKGHKDNFYHTLKVLENVVVKSDNLWLRWAAILHDIAKPKTQKYDEKAGWTFHGHDDLGARMVPKIFARLRLPLNDRMRYVQKLVKLHLRPIALASDEITDAALRRLLFEAGDDIDDLMTLCRADITSKNQLKVGRYLQNFDKVESKLQEIEERDHIRNFQPPVSGEQIMEYFNIQPSREVGQIKDAIKEAILEGKIGNNFEEAFNLMKQIGKQIGLKHNK